ncbi:MAG: hypothetical protein ABIH76_06830 [Candidatus Bathyarchaeota archaeon]
MVYTIKGKIRKFLCKGSATVSLCGACTALENYSKGLTMGWGGPWDWIAATSVTIMAIGGLITVSIIASQTFTGQTEFTLQEYKRTFKVKPKTTIHVLKPMEYYILLNEGYIDGRSQYSLLRFGSGGTLSPEAMKELYYVQLDEAGCKRLDKIKQMLSKKQSWLDKIRMFMWIMPQKELDREPEKNE